MSWLSRIKGSAIGYWQQVVAEHRGYGQIQMVECFFWKVLYYFIPRGKIILKVLKSKRLAASSEWTIESLAMEYLEESSFLNALKLD
jgi:hypothetical protein